MTATTDIEFKGVIKPNDTFDENLFFRISIDLDLREYGFTSPAGKDYFFSDIFNSKKDSPGKILAKRDDFIRIYPFHRPVEIYEYKGGIREFVGTIDKIDPIGNSTPTVFKI